LPAVTAPIVGAPGTVAGVTVPAVDAGPFPAAFVATTVQLYCVPLVKPLTTIGLVVPVFVSADAPLATQEAVYCVIAEPPFDPAAKATDAVPFPAVMTPRVGADGVVKGVADAEEDAGPVPTAFTAATLQLYEVPFTRPVTTIGLVRLLFEMLKVPDVQMAM